MWEIDDFLMTLGNFILPLIILTCLSCAREQDNSQIKTVLRELDETIDNRQRFENETQVKIARLKEERTVLNLELTCIPPCLSNTRTISMIQPSYMPN